MTIDDELILELIKPNKFGEVGDNAFIIKIVGSKNISYKLEEPMLFSKLQTTTFAPMGIKVEEYAGIPDIFVELTKTKQKFVIELENDIHWDFQDSLRQVKKYKLEIENTIIIIPKEYQRFAPLYKNEGIRVFLWEAKRVWQCFQCKTNQENEGQIAYQCLKCKNKNQNDFRLIGLKDTKIDEFI
jgi:hypothetical protein